MRAAAGEFCVATPSADYVPSYELLTHPALGNDWFAPNLREVTAEGVARVMQFFLTAHGLDPVPTAPSADPQPTVPPPLCEDILLDAFTSPGKRG